jgi:hypothetical protein
MPPFDKTAEATQQIVKALDTLEYEEIKRVLRAIGVLYAYRVLDSKR